MTRFSLAITNLLLGIFALAAFLPAAARAQTCNALLATAYSPLAQAAVNDIRTVTLTLGAGQIVGGTQLTINRVRFDLDCDGDSPLTVPCADQGDIFNYQGDASIASDCGACAGGDLNAGASCAPAGPGGGCDAVVIGDNLGTCVALTWTSNLPAGGFAPNEIVFTPSVPIDIPANTNPFCEISFDIQLDNLEPTLGPVSDGTPADVEVVGGLTGTDADCDNLLNANPVSDPAFIPIQPPASCGNGTVEAGETCDPPGNIPVVPPGNVNECRADCTYCGDGILTPPETCDTAGVPNRSCNSNCTGRIARDPASIVFHREGTTGFDRLQVNGLLMPELAIYPNEVVFGVRLSNANGLILALDLPTNSIVKNRGRAYKYRNRDAKIDGGFYSVTFRPHREDGYRVKLVAYGDLSAATEAQMTVELDFGGQQFIHSAIWAQTRRGWRDSGHTELIP